MTCAQQILEWHIGKADWLDWILQMELTPKSLFSTLNIGCIPSIIFTQNFLWFALVVLNYKCNHLDFWSANANMTGFSRTGWNTAGTKTDGKCKWEESINIFSS